LLIAVLLVAASVGFLFLPIRAWFVQLQGWVGSRGALGPVVVAAAYVAMTVLLIPGSALTIGAGTIFGLWMGALVVIVGANVGALGSFLLARTVLREKVARWAEANPAFASLDRAIGQAGFTMVMLSRLSPAFPFTILNYVLGLTTVRTGSYVLANLLGMLPGIFLYVYLGATAGEALTGGSASSAGLFQHTLHIVGLLATVAVVVLVTRLARKALAETAEARPMPNLNVTEVL
jgi:uncharacterized membrane protein YdjX (TVP38/TMEM64 family)